jgi:acetolactate synthase-1/2/3 large subunit
MRLGSAILAATAAGKPAIIHVKTDAEALTSRITLTQLREQSLARQKLA